MCALNFDVKIVFGYSIYDLKKDEITRALILSVAKLFKKYEDYSLGKNKNRLLEVLNFNSNIIYYEVNDNDLVKI